MGIARIPKQLHSLLHRAVFTANLLKLNDKSTGGSSVNLQIVGSSPARGASIYMGLGLSALFPVQFLPFDRFPNANRMAAACTHSKLRSAEILRWVTESVLLFGKCLTWLLCLKPQSYRGFLGEQYNFSLSKVEKLITTMARPWFFT
jgi:hypothetical protein